MTPGADQLRRILDRTTDAVVAVDADWTIEYVNERLADRTDRDAVVGETLWAAFPDIAGTAFEEQCRAAMRTGDPVQFEQRLPDPFDCRVEVRAFPDETGLTVFSRDITDRKRTERQLRALQQTARRLNLAESETDIYDLAVEAAGDILDLPLTGVWRYDEPREALLPVLMSEEATRVFDRQPRFDPSNSLAWEAFEADEVRIYDDLHEQPDRYNPDTPMGSEIIVPLGDQGLMITGSPTPQEFSDRDVDLFRVLGSTVEAALVRADREAELRQQNDRLDEFASVVAHDLRNPLSTASGFLDLARKTGDLEQLDEVESAHDRMERLIDGLLTLARGEATVADAERLRLDQLAREAWRVVDTDDANLTVAEEGVELAGDRDRLLQLFENLFRNAVEHGGEAVSVRVGPLADGDGFYVADDGPGIPPDRRDEVFDYGVSYSDGGTGFGLSIVADVAQSHGWEVDVTESADGGARFEFSDAVVPD